MVLHVRYQRMFLQRLPNINQNLVLNAKLFNCPVLKNRKSQNVWTCQTCHEFATCRLPTAGLGIWRVSGLRICMSMSTTNSTTADMLSCATLAHCSTWACQNIVHFSMSTYTHAHRQIHAHADTEHAERHVQHTNADTSFYTVDQS